MPHASHNPISIAPMSQTAPEHRIRRYERLLQKEINEFGQISDGYGKRYLLGSLYLLLGDTAGALAHYEWFEAMFPENRGHPMHLLCWSLVLYRVGQPAAAATKLRQLVTDNRYVLPRLLSGETPVLDLEVEVHPGEVFTFEDVPTELYALWDEKALTWAQTVYDSPEVCQLRAK